jgi:hypothetical protein
LNAVLYFSFNLHLFEATTTQALMGGIFSSNSSSFVNPFCLYACKELSGLLPNHSATQDSQIDGYSHLPTQKELLLC